jgi:hypothetical protein
MERKYTIEVAKHVNTRFGDTILLSLRVEEETLVKVFLPKRYSGAFTDEALEAINRGTLSLHLIYKGKCAPSGTPLLAID